MLFLSSPSGHGHLSHQTLGGTSIYNNNNQSFAFSSQVNLSPLKPNICLTRTLPIPSADVCESRSTRSIHRNACQRKLQSVIKIMKTAGWVWQVYNIPPSFFSFYHLIFSPLSHRVKQASEHWRRGVFQGKQLQSKFHYFLFSKHSELPTKREFKVHYTYQYWVVAHVKHSKLVTYDVQCWLESCLCRQKRVSQLISI